MSSKIWSRARANDWYARMPWMRGCNYMPPECINRIDVWQSLHFERNLKSMEQDFALMRQIGFNSIRVILEFLVWDREHDRFLVNFERFLALAARYGISVVVCLANDCERARYHETSAKLGPQRNDLGWHGGRKPRPAPEHPAHPLGYYPELDDPDTRERFFAMVRELVGKYAGDERIAVWDLCNEPGYAPERSLPLLKRIFEEARRIETVQPLTSGIWWKPLCAAQAAALELSDVISYHNYRDYESNIDGSAAARAIPSRKCSPSSTWKKSAAGTGGSRPESIRLTSITAGSWNPSNSENAAGTTISPNGCTTSSVRTGCHTTRTRSLSS